MKLPPWSWSLLDTADRCLLQAKHKYVVRDLPREPETEPMRWGNKVHRGMENRLKIEAPLTDGMEPFEVFVAPLDVAPGQLWAEKWFGMREDGSPCRSLDDDCWGRGKLDVSIVDDTYALIVDWKTGKVREDPDELEIGAVLLKATYPKLERISGWFVWLKERRTGKVHDLSDTAGKLENIRQRYARLEEAVRMDHFPAQQNPLCPWCPVMTCSFNPRRN